MYRKSEKVVLNNAVRFWARISLAVISIPFLSELPALRKKVLPG